MIKPKPENWLKVCLILIPILLSTLVIVASDRSRERARNIELENISKERIEKIESEMKNMYKQIKKLESSKTISSVKPTGNSVVDTIYAKFGVKPLVVELARCESGLNPYAFNQVDTNGVWSAGLFQINAVHKGTPEYWFNINNNVNKAWALSNGGVNWDPWENCAYSVGLLGV